MSISSINGSKKIPFVIYVSTIYVCDRGNTIT